MRASREELARINSAIDSFYTWCLLTIGFFAIVTTGVVLTWPAPPATETISQLNSPNGQWNISEEFAWRPSCFRIILRDSTGKVIARTKDRFVASHLIDSPRDHRSELEITDDTAGEKDRPVWRLDRAQNKWHIDPLSDVPVEPRVPAD